MTIERINDLYGSGKITAKEHDYLIRQHYDKTKGNSTISYLTMICALLTWLSIITVTINGQKIGLFPNSESRLWISAFLSIIVIILFLSAKRKANESVNAIRAAYIGLGIIIPALLIVIPSIIMEMNSF